MAMSWALSVAASSASMRGQPWVWFLEGEQRLWRVHEWIVVILDSGARREIVNVL